jgi:hypothetical protein
MPTNSAINTTNPIGIVSGGTNASSLNDQYGSIYYDGSQLQSTNSGINGSVLRSNGAFGPPSFQASPGAGGSWVFIETKTATNDTQVVFNTISSASFMNYVFIVNSCQLQNGNPILGYQVSSDGGSTWTTGAGNLGNAFTSGGNGTVEPTGSPPVAGMTTSLTRYAEGIFWLYGITPTSGHQVISYTVITSIAGLPNGQAVQVLFANATNNTNINAVRFVSNGIGLIPFISASLYGVTT